MRLGKNLPGPSVRFYRERAQWVRKQFKWEPGEAGSHLKVFYSSQIVSAYCRTARSEEKYPAAATLCRHFLAKA